MTNPKAKHRVLLIEDDSVIAKSFDQFLARHGFEVSICTNPKSGCQQCESGKFDAVVTDISFRDATDESGLELMKKIRRGNRNLPIIAISAIPLFYLNKDFNELPFDDFLPKPIINDELLEKLKRLIG